MGVEVEDSSSGDTSDGEWHMKLPFLALQLTSCCAAKFLTGMDQYQSAAGGEGSWRPLPALENFYQFSSVQ